MKIYEYQDYDEYVREQTRANVLKLDRIWVEEGTIDQIQQRVRDAQAIICHGTRNAAEQTFFKKKYPDALVIGTEISHTATQFPMTVQHDFHEQREEWVGKFDIVYSNSFDHSYDPHKSLGAWAEQLKDGGWLFLEVGSGDNNRSKSTDPLEIEHPRELYKLFKEVGLTYVDQFRNNLGNATIYITKK